MEKKVFEFPTLDDGVFAIENKFCEIVTKFREGEQVEPEEVDFMDWANNVLQSV